MAQECTIADLSTRSSVGWIYRREFSAPTCASHGGKPDDERRFITYLLPEEYLDGPVMISEAACTACGRTERT